MTVTDSDAFRKRDERPVGQLVLPVLGLEHYSRGLKIWRS